MEFLKQAAKAVVAFVLPILVNMVMDLVNGNAPFPQTGQEWLRYVLSSVVTGLGVYGVPNKQSEKQITESLQKLPDEQAKSAVTTAYPRWVID